MMEQLKILEMAKYFVPTDASWFKKGLIICMDRPINEKWCANDRFKQVNVLEVAITYVVNLYIPTYLRVVIIICTSRSTSGLS